MTNTAPNVRAPNGPLDQTNFDFLRTYCNMLTVETFYNIPRIFSAAAKTKADGNTAIASAVFKCPPEAVRPLQRRYGKSLLHLALYSTNVTAEQLGDALLTCLLSSNGNSRPDGSL